MKPASLAFWLGITISLVLVIGTGVVLLPPVLANPPGSVFQITFTWIEPTLIFISLLMLLPLFCFLGWQYLRETKLQESRQPRPIIRIYPEGVGITDYELVENVLFTEYNDLEFALHPLQHGFSGTYVFRVNPRNSLPAVLKLGPRDKILEEEQRYQQFVKNKLLTVSLKKMQDNGGRGLLLYEYGSMTPGESLTFEEFFLDSTHSAVEVQRVIQKLFGESLIRWLNDFATETQYLYQDYCLNNQDWNRIQRAIHDLGFDPHAVYFDEIDPRNLLEEIMNLFDERRDKPFSTRQTIVHGDLNARNILIDGNSNIFVIDFAKTGRNCSLRDFCKLETEIAYCLTRLPDDDALRRAVELEKNLLLDGNKPFTTLESLFAAGPDLSTDNQFALTAGSIRKIRNLASRVMGIDAVNCPAEQYYLMLLHHTLDVLRYKQCDRRSKLFALHSLVILCDALR